ncbi:MAG TPA: hypothetical protein DCZ95_08570 [Verrucomicrobia bacterium]|nr:MAG: hypothetical protein A2X46_12605 [Lentisphaerae bacterium GWF2_57_35]HBA84132.1 hypothetical protein [Verrucomicrobiota bacterium]
MSGPFLQGPEALGYLLAPGSRNVPSSADLSDEDQHRVIAALLRLARAGTVQTAAVSSWSAARM